MTVHSASGFRAHRGEVLDGGELAGSLRLGQLDFEHTEYLLLCILPQDFERTDYL